LGVIAKKFEYGPSQKLSSSISLFSELVRGGRYSYTYSGDLNNDGSGLNDLLYVPTDSQIDAMNFVGADAAAQKTAFKAYIAQDDYLSGKRGNYTKKYAALSPWYNHVDLRFVEGLKLPKKQSVELSIDVINIGNLLSSKWGVRKFASYTGLAQPLATGKDASGITTYSFDTAQKSTFFNDFSPLSRWQMQVGLRYNF
jgi:hypothetical protein